MYFNCSAFSSSQGPWALCLVSISGNNHNRCQGAFNSFWFNCLMDLMDSARPSRWTELLVKFRDHFDLNLWMDLTAAGTFIILPKAVGRCQSWFGKDNAPALEDSKDASRFANSGLSKLQETPRMSKAVWDSVKIWIVTFMTAFQAVVRMELLRKLPKKRRCPCPQCGKIWMDCRSSLSLSDWNPDSFPL